MRVPFASRAPPANFPDLPLCPIERRSWKNGSCDVLTGAMLATGVIHTVLVQTTFQLDVILIELLILISSTYNLLNTKQSTMNAEEAGQSCGWWLCGRGLHASNRTIEETSVLLALYLIRKHHDGPHRWKGYVSRVVCGWACHPSSVQSTHSDLLVLQHNRHLVMMSQSFN